MNININFPTYVFDSNGPTLLIHNKQQIVPVLRRYNKFLIKVKDLFICIRQFMDKATMINICKTIRNNDMLEFLCFDNTILGDDACFYLAETLKTNKFIKKLSLRNTKISSKAVSCISLVIAENVHVTTLSLQGNENIDMNDVDFIQDCVKRNQRLLKNFDVDVKKEKTVLLLSLTKSSVFVPWHIRIELMKFLNKIKNLDIVLTSYDKEKLSATCKKRKYSDVYESTFNILNDKTVDLCC